jgi:diguanylate cyclase (GGDEF)-like protein
VFANLLKAYRSSIQFKLFISLTAIAALSLAAILISQVYLVQEYFIHQAEANLRSSNYLLSRVLADPIFEKDLTLLQSRLQAIQTKLPLCNFQLKDNVGTVVYKVGEVNSHVDTDFDPSSHDGCHNTVIPVIHGDEMLGTMRLGVRTDDIAQARKDLIQQSAFFALFWFSLFMLPFFLQIRRMVRPLVNLSKAAQQFADGNLDYPAPALLRGEDELSQLTVSFQGLSQALVNNRDFQASALAALSDEKTTLDTLLATLPVGVFFADRTHIRFCNNAFRKMCLLSPNEQLVGMKNEALLSRLGLIAAEAEKMLKTVAEILETRQLSEPKFVVLKDGRTLRMISNTVIAPENRGYLGRFWMFEDVTEEKALLQMAELRAEHDALTLLYNRQRFDSDLARLFAQAERDKSQLSLMIFDLDDFKPVNDEHGHAAGDIALKRVSQTLTLQLRRNEVLYRVGGDEFALLLVNTSEGELAILAERIVHSINALTFDFNGATVKVGCSLGIARYPHDAATTQTLLHCADQAMYAAKQRGKNNWVMFPIPV